MIGSIIRNLKNIICLKSKSSIMSYSIGDNFPSSFKPKINKIGNDLSLFIKKYDSTTIDNIPASVKQTINMINSSEYCSIK